MIVVRNPIDNGVIWHKTYGMAAEGATPRSDFVVRATPNAIQNSPASNIKMRTGNFVGRVNLAVLFFGEREVFT